LFRHVKLFEYSDLPVFDIMKDRLYLSDFKLNQFYPYHGEIYHTDP